MKTIGVIVISMCIWACGKPKANSIELITFSNTQDSIFQCLMKVAQHGIPEGVIKDSLAFLILPVQASCPSCRKKTIDSIMKYNANLAEKHFIIISANGGRKTIRGYFQEQDYDLPIIQDRLFLDSINQAYKYNLYNDKPTLYYSFNKKVYKKVAAIPATVKEDLKEFFSGYRN